MTKKELTEALAAAQNSLAEARAITLDLARKAIAAAREIEVKRTQGLWNSGRGPLFKGRERFVVRGPVGEYIANTIHQVHRARANNDAIILWSGAFGALLTGLELDLDQDEIEYEGDGEYQLGIGYFPIISALMESLDRAAPGWRER